MIYGLRVWDSAGALRLDISDRLGRLHSLHYIGYGTLPPGVEQFVSVAGMATDGTWVLGTIGTEVGYRVEYRVATGGFWVINNMWGEGYPNESCTIGVFRG